MTAEQRNLMSEEFDLASERKERARLLIVHNVIQRLWQSGQPMRTSELASFDGVQLFLGLVRQTLFDCEHLISLGRHWDFRWRQGAATAPLSGLVMAVLTIKGVPMTPDEIAQTLTAWRRQPASELARMVMAILESRVGKTVFLLDEKRFGLLDWLPKVKDVSLNEAIDREFWGQEAFAHWLITQAKEVIKDNPVANATMLLNTIGLPLTHRELLFAFQVRSGEPTDLTELLQQLLNDGDLQVLSLGYWVTSKSLESLREEVLKQSEEFWKTAHQRTRQTDITRILQAQPLPKEPKVELSYEETDNIFAWLTEQPHPVPLERIAENVLEVLPGDPDYPQTVRALVNLLRNDERFSEFGGHCWWLADKTPTGVTEIPEVLLPTPLPPLPSELTGQFDLELPLEALDEDLRYFVEHPNYEEVGEPRVRLPEELKPPKRVEIAVIYPHLKAGTMKLKQIDTPFFEPGLSLQFFMAADDKGNQVPLWMNLALGLCFGLGEWYSKRKVGIGGLVRLERSKSGAMILRWTNRYDLRLHISRPRLDELLKFSTHETVREVPLIVLLQYLLAQYPKGIHFLGLWSELNVLRRTTKQVLASLLCAYPMFTRVPNTEGYWTIDFSKTGEGIREDKRSYLEGAMTTRQGNIRA